MTLNSRTFFVAYIPVLHEGYIRWIYSSLEKGTILLVPPELVSTERWIAKDIRALSLPDISAALRGVFPSLAVEIFSSSTVLTLERKGVVVHMPDDVDMRSFAHTYLPGVTITWDRVFLRWDRGRIEEVLPISTGSVLPESQIARLMGIAFTESLHSPDFWLQVGAVAFRDGEVLITAYNTHVPSEHSVYATGDPRMFYTRGVRTDLSVADHAERVLIGRAAREGLRLSGADLYLTTFPCPACAYQIIDAGFQTVYYREGYSILDAAGILRAAGVSLVQVQKENPDSP